MTRRLNHKNIVFVNQFHVKLTPITLEVENWDTSVSVSVAAKCLIVAS